MMGKILSGIFITFAFFGITDIVLAHVTLADGPMEVFSHIDPDDDPVARDPGGFFLVFDDKTGKFDPTKCQCVISVKKGDEIVWSDTLFKTLDPDNATTTYAEYSFPEKGVYDVEIKGSPKVAGVFASFEVHRIVRVDKESAAPTSEPANYLVYAIFAAALVIVAFLFTLESRRSGRSRDKGSSKTAVIVAFSAFLLLSLLFHEANAAGHVDLHTHEDTECCAMQAAGVSPSRVVVESNERVSFQLADIPSLPYAFDSAASVNNNSPPF